MNTAVQFNEKTNFHLHLVKSANYQERQEIYEAKLMAHVEEFKSAVFEYVEAEQKGGNDLEALAGAVAMSLLEVQTAMDKWLGDNSFLSDGEREIVGSKIRREMAPYMLLSNLANRMYTKPRGYAGDFLTIQHMYDEKPAGTNGVGKVIDMVFLNNPASKAVQNRRGLLAEVIDETIDQNGNESTNITSFACGPAQELFDVNERLDDSQQVKANLIDIDIQALAHVGQKIESADPKIKFELFQENLIYLSMGRKKINLPKQDLIYSIGLIDYFNDKLVIKLMNYAYDLLKEGGRVVFGNFHVDNPIKALMDHMLEWKLIHRSEEDMDRLFKASKFGKACSEIRYEGEGINMFAICVK